jgi:uncharacterized membrane protein YvbJ
MFCPQCGASVPTGAERFCKECGAELGRDPGQGATTLPRHVLSNRLMKKDHAMKTLLIVAGLVLLVPLALHLFFGLLLASLVASVALVAMAIKLAPVLALGLVLYWIVTRRRRTLRSER